MIEFLVKRLDGDWFDLPEDSDPYRPITFPYKSLEGWGDNRIEVADCEISFSYEDPGIQVSFEGPIDENEAAQIAEEIRKRIQEVSGQQAELIRIA